MKLYSRVILLLLILQADVTGFLVWLSFASNPSEDTFALLLTIDLVAFAMMTYIYRTEKLNALPSKVWVVVGSAIIVGLFFSSLIFT
jgi:RsiW-degrading membrane proteinase PrsW (M82 family)